MTINAKENLDQNVKVLAEALAAVGAVSVTAEYYGYGDSGEEFSIAIQWPDNKAGEEPGEVTYKAVRMKWNQGQPPEYFIEEATTDFENALHSIGYDAISEAGHSGYENNDGGGGIFTVHANGTGVLEHYDNVVEQVYDYTSYGESKEEPVSPEAVSCNPD